MRNYGNTVTCSSRPRTNCNAQTFLAYTQTNSLRLVQGFAPQTPQTISLHIHTYANSWATSCCVEASNASAHADSLRTLMQLCVCGDASKGSKEDAKNKNSSLLGGKTPALQAAQLAVQSKVQREKEVYF